MNIMDSRMLLMIFFSIVTMPTMSIQDGFNYFKALNRTPTIRRVERFYEDGLSRMFKVPLSLQKRVLYEGSFENDNDVSQKKLSNDLSEKIPTSLSDGDILTYLLMCWFPPKSKLKRDDIYPFKRNMKKYTETQNVYLGNE